MPSEDNVQILKESKARFEGVIFKQTANLGTNKETSCKVIDEATGEVIVQSGGGSGESDFTTAKLTLVAATSTEYITCFVPVQAEDKATYIVECDSTEVEFDVILYKGKSCLSIPLDISSSYTFTTSGDITYNDQTYLYDITGDCTLTATAK